MPAHQARPTPGDFKEKQFYAYGAIAAVIALGSLLTQNSFPKMLGEDAQHFSSLGFAQLSVLAALVVLTVRWMDATAYELKLWLTWTSMNEEPRHSWGAMFGIAAYLGGTIAFIARPVIAIAWFTLGSGFSVWTQWYCCRFFADASPLDESVETIPVAMTHYWTRRPQVFRVALITLFSTIALLFAVTGWRWSRGHGDAYTLTAYWILFGIVVVAESQIHFWRRIRDCGIEFHERKEPARLEEGYCQAECRLQASLALLPVLSFVLQLYFSLAAGTVGIMFHHPAVMYADWLLIPFNYFAVSAINWTRGVTLYLITAVSTVLVLLTHAIWAIQGTDPGHMITHQGVILAAGWVHIGFSILEMTLLVAFVFCRRAANMGWIANLFGTAYFVAIGEGGYQMHHHLILSDAVVLIAGVVFLALIPTVSALWKLARRTVPTTA